MSTAIIASMRQQPLRGNTFLIATELAHRLNGSGLGSVSYQYLAWKAHCCRQTAITQIAKLLALGLIRKTVLRTKEGYAWNHYQYIGPRVHIASPPVTTHSTRVVSTLPEDQREKELALGAELEQLRKGLRFLSNPDTPMYQACIEKIAALEALAAARVA